jgi:hypothetical protein
MESSGQMHLVRAAIKKSDNWERTWGHVLSHTTIVNSTYQEMCDMLYARNVELTHEGYWTRNTSRASVNSVEVVGESGNSNYKGKKPFCPKCKRNHWPAAGCESTTAGSYCYHCHGKDHVMKNCPSLKTESGTKRPNEANSSDSNVSGLLGKFGPKKT